VRNSVVITLDGKEYEVTRAKLRVWLQLEDIHEQIARATESRDKDGFITSIYSYLSVALSVDMDFSTLPWYEVTGVYVDISLVNRPHLDLPYLRMASKAEKVPWEYDGRTWYFWSHILAKEYGWQLEYIAEMDVDDSIAHLQEIATSSQMQREWEWMLSDKSVSYDKKGKGTFHDLTRPSWMGGKHIPKDKQQKLGDTIPMKESAIPVGNVVRWKDGSIVAQ
jgi:hypothetical protein